MQALYEIANEAQLALMSLQDLLEAGEIDQQTFNDTAEGIEGEVKQKCINVALYIKNLEADAARYGEAKEQFAAKQKRAENAIEFFMNYLATNMQKSKLTDIKDQFVDIRHKKMPAVVEITNESHVPRDFLRCSLSWAPDKVAIKQALADGQKLGFAKMVTGRTKLVVE